MAKTIKYSTRKSPIRGKNDESSRLFNPINQRDQHQQSEMKEGIPTCTCQDPVDATCQHQLLLGLEGQQLVRGDEGRGSKLGAGLVQRLGGESLDRRQRDNM